MRNHACLVLNKQTRNSVCCSPTLQETKHADESEMSSGYRESDDHVTYEEEGASRRSHHGAIRATFSSGDTAHQRQAAVAGPDVLCQNPRRLVEAVQELVGRSERPDGTTTTKKSTYLFWCALHWIPE